MFRQRVLRVCLGLLLGLPVLAAAGCGSGDDAAPLLGPDSGQVRAEVTANGQPLPGVTAALTGDVTRTATTGANGVALFTGLPNGNYTLMISGFDTNRFTFARTQVPVAISDATGLVTVQFQGIGPSTGAITGRVTVNGQAPAQLGGQTVTVTLVPPVGSPVTGDLTGTTGEYAFRQLAPGQYTLRVAVGNDVRTTTVNIAEGQQLQANLEFANLPGFTPAPIGEPTGQVRAQVTAAGVPVPGVTVTLGDGLQRTATTGADGLATFDNVPNGTFTVSISGWDTSRFLFTTTSVTVTLDENVGQVTAQFQGVAAATGALTGRVTVNGQAPSDIPGQTVTITLVPPVANALTGDLTGTTGEFTFGQLSPGAHTLRVTVGSQTRSTTLTLAQGERRDLNVVEFNQLSP